jgi:hypothetical protein
VNWGPNQISETILDSLIRLRGPSSRRGRDPRVVGVFGVANLACDLGDRYVRSWEPLSEASINCPLILRVELLLVQPSLHLLKVQPVCVRK